MNRYVDELVKFLRFSVAMMLGLAAVLAVGLALFLWAAKYGPLKIHFSQVACEKEGGTWDAAVELCRDYD